MRSAREKLVAPDGVAGALFGSSVAAYVDTAVVGAFSDDTSAGTNAGFAYVFVGSGTTWTAEAKLTAPNGAAGDLFGKSAALSGDTAVIGADYDQTPAGTHAGSAYVFIRSGTTWTGPAQLTASDGATFDLFGSDVSGDTAVIGAYRDDTVGGTNAGSAYVFIQSGTTWTERTHLTASDGAGDRFGYSVAVSGDTSVIGAYYDDTLDGIKAGSAHVFWR
jgi:hypothetical protein